VRKNCLIFFVVRVVRIVRAADQLDGVRCSVAALYTTDRVENTGTILVQYSYIYVYPFLPGGREVPYINKMEYRTKSLLQLH
jgi:hypothetical protein